jgi:chromosome segregation ATPase
MERRLLHRHYGDASYDWRHAEQQTLKGDRPTSSPLNSEQQNLVLHWKSQLLRLHERIHHVRKQLHELDLDEEGALNLPSEKKWESDQMLEDIRLDRESLEKDLDFLHTVKEDVHAQLRMFGAR